MSSQYLLVRECARKKKEVALKGKEKQEERREQEEGFSLIKAPNFCLIYKKVY